MLAALAALAAPAQADAQTVEETEDPANPFAIEIHGFVSQGFIKTTDNNYLAKSEDGSAEFAEAGINFTKELSDELRVGLQLFSRDLGPIGDYKPIFDWFYLDYRFRDWFGVRLGRMKQPFGLYNETSDIDAARVPVLLPQSMYPTDSRDFLLAQTGIEIYGRTPQSKLGSLEYRLYGGTIFADPSGELAPGFSIEESRVPYVVGGRLMWATPIDGVQLGGSTQFLRFEADYAFSPALTAAFQQLGYLPPGFQNPLEAPFNVRLHVASIEFAADEFLFAAEYGRWIGEFESGIPGLLPSRTENERYYVMASYRVTPWFTPSIYYSVLHPLLGDTEGREKHQYDLALSFRYDLTDNWLFKIEGHYMDGTAALSSKLNDWKDQKTLVETWGVLLLKTTAYF